MMSNKLSTRARADRAALTAVLALLFAGSAAATIAGALGLSVSAPALYLAAALAAALCALGASSRGGAALAGALFAVGAGVYIAANAAGLGALRALMASWAGESADAAQVAAGGRTLMTCGAFVLAALFFALLARREFVALAVMLLLGALVACHAMSADAPLGAAVPGLAACACAFALTGGLQRDISALRALLPGLLAVALALALLPGGRVTWPPMERAAQQVRAVVEQYFNFTRQRVAFSISEQGYDHAGEVGDSVVAMLGGPAEPHTDPVMRVETDREVLLRGAIRTAYTGYSWVDAAPKSRYLYYDLTHAATRDRVFSPPAGLKDALAENDVAVELLDDGTGTLFVPTWLEKFSMGLSTAVYYNTAGEMFLSRDVAPGDAYSLRALLPVEADALRQAVLRGEEAGDDRYREILAQHSQLPDGLEGGVYALTAEVVRGADNPWDRAVAIMDYLRRNMRYTLKPAYPPQGRDFVSYFLLEGKEGYCSYFASAMAVMGRVAGLPTRYVEGFLARPGREALTGEDAHAWAEVYFKGVGWVPFDATGGTTASGGDALDENDDGGADGRMDAAEPPAGDGDALPEATPTPSPAPESGAEDAPTPTPEPQNGPDGGGVDEPLPSPDAPPEAEDAPEPEGDKRNSPLAGWLLGLVLLIAAIALAARWVRGRLAKSDPAALCGKAGSAREAAMIVYRANLTLLAHMGQAPAGGEAPEAFAARVSAQLRNADYAAFVSAVARSRYGRRPLARADIEAGLRAYVGFKGAMGRREKLRFALTRVFRGLGSFEQIP